MPVENLSLESVSNVGRLLTAEVNPESETEIYLNYPEVRNLLSRASTILNSGKKIKFKLKNQLQFNSLCFANKTNSNPDPYSGLAASHYNILLTQNLAGQVILGNFTLAHLESKIAKAFHETLHNNQAVDHFYFTEGISNLSVVDDAIKAHDIKKNELAVALIPSNAIKAFRRTRFSGWNLVETKSQPSSINNGKIYQVDKDRNLLSEINLIEHQAINLDSPIYKLKLGERWVIVITANITPTQEDKPVEINLSKTLIDSLHSYTKFDTKLESQLETEEIDCSIGQAARVIFNLLGGDYELLPELMLNLEGGSWSAMVTEHSASGRHNGTNTMHEVLKHSWHKHPEAAIPWNYLGLDRITDENAHLLNDPSVYILAFDSQQDLYLECPQNWKKLQVDLIQYVVKFVYREYSGIASKKFLLSTKEQMQIAARYLAHMSISGFNPEAISSLKKINIQDDLAEFLEILLYTHLFAASRGDFYSSKIHPYSLARLKALSLIESKLEKFCPVNVGNFKTKIRDILGKDTLSEGTTLLEIYKSIV